MASLDDYVMSEFDQGTLLKSLFPLKTKAAEGVCYALVIEYYRQRTKNIAAVAPGTMTTRLTESLGTCISRQSMQEDGLEELKRKGGGVYDFLQLFNMMGRVSGIAFALDSGGTTYDEFLTALKAANGDMMLRVEFTSGGGHAIAIADAPSFEIFDPNFGVIQSSALERGMATKQLWAKYSSLNMVINRWWILTRKAGSGVGMGGVGKA